MQASTSAFPALVRRAVLDARVRTIVFAYMFAVYSYLQPAGYRSAFPTLLDREAFAASFAGNDAIRLFYGFPYSVTTVNGYTAWRVGGTLSIVAAVFGVLAGIRALRTEEDSGRTEIVLSGCVSRRTNFAAGLAAIAAGSAVLWLAQFVGFVAARLAVGGSAYLALATASVLPLFAGVGAVASQLAPTRRGALAMASAVVAACWLLRVVGDTWSAGAWLRWTTPLGWAEQMRPFTGAEPLVLALPLAATVPLLVVAERISCSRDVGAGLLPARDSAAPRHGLLSSSTAQALRVERGMLAVWMVAIAAFGAVLGMVSTSVSTAGISSNLSKELEKLGTGSVTTPSGYLAFVFVIVVLAVCVFVCSQIAAIRAEESAERLETLLAQPVGRARWLAGRLLLGTVVSAVLAADAGVFTWAGAASQGVAVSLPRMLEAGANCLPASLLFAGISSLAYSLVPRASTATSYGLVSAAFLWYLVGSLFRVPRWLVGLTPFEHIGFVPAEPFRLDAAVVMAGIGLAAAALSILAFRRRDLVGS
jgi:ABC-2 type transport system permease protein